MCIYTCLETLFPHQADINIHKLYANLTDIYYLNAEITVQRKCHGIRAIKNVMRIRYRACLNKLKVVLI